MIPNTIRTDINDKTDTYRYWLRSDLSRDIYPCQQLEEKKNNQENETALIQVMSQDHKLFRVIEWKSLLLLRPERIQFV